MPIDRQKKAAREKEYKEKTKAARAAAVQRLANAKAGDIEAFARAYFEALRHATPGVLRDEFEAFLREAPTGRATEATTELLGMVEAVLGRNRERNNAQSLAKLHRRLRAMVAADKVLDVPTYLNPKRAAVIASIDNEVACCVGINQ